MEQLYPSWLTRRLARPLAALGLLLATAGVAQAQSSFGTATTYSVGTSPLGLAVADLNGDGRPDVVTANQNSTNVSVLFGQASPAGSLGTATNYGLGSSRPTGVALGDVNGDGRPDIVVGNQSSTVAVLLNSASAPGTFLAAVTYGSGGSTSNLPVLADFNGDGRLDIAIVNTTSGTVGVLLASATTAGTFGPATAYATGNSNIVGIAAGDLNRDGRPDLVVGSSSNGNVAVLLNSTTAPGTFPTAVNYANGGNYIVGLKLGDVNGDANLDIVTGNLSSSNLSVLLGTATGTFGAATLYSSGGSSVNLVDLADINGDNLLDIIAANQGTSTLGVLTGQAAPAGTFATAATYTTGGTGTIGVVAADLDGDGQRDLIATNYTSGTVAVLLNTLGTPTLSSLSPTSGVVGTQVTLTGTNLTGATAVSFNGTAATTFAVVNSTTLTATVPVGATSGPVSVTTPSGTSNGVQFTVLTNAPVVTAPANNSTTNGLPTFTGTAPAGSTVTIYLAMGGGASQALGTTTAAGGNFSFTPATALTSGPYAVYATAQSSGQAGSANSNTNVFTVDATPPTATIGTSSGSPTSTTPIPFSVSFSEPVTGLSASSFTVSNGTVTSNSLTGSGASYSFSVTPTGPGVVSVSLPANAVRDVVGNVNGASNTVSVQYTAPITATTWTGTSSTDWFTAGNWTAGVPNATIDATIPTAPSSGRFPAVSAGTATVRNLTFNSGATLNQSGGTIAIAANLTNNGTFLPTGGTVNLGTTTLSNVLGSSNIRFWNLTVGANGAQLSTSIGASVQRLLTLNGNFATNGNSFVLESNNTLTALVANNNSSVVNGTVTVQRAIDPSVNPGPGYRHYSSPVSNATVGDLATSGFTPVVNPAFNSVASPYTITPYPTVYGYDDSRLTLTNNLDMFDKGYYSPSALSDPLVVGRGYTVNIGASEVVDFQGTLNTGDRTLNLTSTRNNYPDGGWQFLGNPYPSPLDYSRVAAADRNGLESAIYVYSSTSQYFGRYRVYINGIGNPVVPLGQGFFARVADGQSTATMNFRNSQRLTAPNGTTMQRTTADPRPLVQLTLQGASPALADEAYVYFENGATSGFEPEFDAEKLANSTGLNLSTSLATGQHLSIDGQPELGTAQRVVPLAVGVPTAGVYTFTASQLLNLSAVPVYLRDLQLGTLTDLRQQPTYQFTVSNAAALNTTRFALVFSPQQPLATAPAALAEQVGLYPNPAKTTAFLELPASLGRQAVTAALVDALGRVVRTVTLPAQGAQAHQLDLHELPTGVYALRLTTSAGPIVKRLTVE